MARQCLVDIRYEWSGFLVALPHARFVTLCQTLLVATKRGKTTDAPATQRRMLLLSCGASCFVVCCHAFALACRARGLFPCAKPLPTAGWCRPQSPPLRPKRVPFPSSRSATAGPPG